MKLYCFLFIIIVLLIIYDNYKMYEGNDEGVYDTKTGDKLGTYDQSELNKEANMGSLMDELAGGEIPFAKKYLPVGSYTDDAKCKPYSDVKGTKDSSCVDTAGLKEQSTTKPNSKWVMGSGYTKKISAAEAAAGDAAMGAVVGSLIPGVGTLAGAAVGGLIGAASGGETVTSDEKKRCMDCLQCSYNNALPREFYGYMCDGIEVCLDDPETYVEDSIPAIHAYNNVDWDKACDKPTCPDGGPYTDNCKNPLQNGVCHIIVDGPSSIYDMLLLPKKPDSIECAVKIEAQDKENEAASLVTSGGSTVSNLANKAEDAISSVF